MILFPVSLSRLQNTGMLGNSDTGKGKTALGARAIALLKAHEPTGCLKKKYPLLTGNRNEIIRYHYSPSGQLNLSIFNLDPHTLHLKIAHQTLEIQACKVKIYSAPETRGSVKGPSHNLLSQACCTGISTLTFSFFH